MNSIINIDRVMSRVGGFELGWYKVSIMPDVVAGLVTVAREGSGRDHQRLSQCTG